MMQILVIDDDVQVRGMLCEMLQNGGYGVLEADNGKTGMAHMNRSHVDVVVTDIFMPEKEGIETIMEVRKKFPAVKIIAISGGTPRMPADFLATAKMVGAHKTMEKPILQQDLLDAVAEICK